MEAPFLAEIRYIPARHLPDGWAWCEGQELRIAEHPDLFELLGTTYGGDGQATFALPNLLGRKLVELESHSVSVGAADQPAGQFGIKSHSTQVHHIQPYRATHFCIALQGVFPASSKGSHYGC